MDPSRSAFTALFVAALLATGCASRQQDASSNPSADAQSAPTYYLTRASGIRARQAPDPEAPILATLSVGTELISPPEAELHAQWVQIALPGGEVAWISAPLLLPYEPAGRTEAWRSILDARMARGGLSFQDWVDLLLFVEDASRTVTPAEAGPFLLARWQIMGEALETVKFELQSTEPYQSWLKLRAAQGHLTFSEPHGAYLLATQPIWADAATLKAAPEGDALAYFASQQPLGGECEGYLPCYLYMLRATRGQYLVARPGGAHTQEILRALTEDLNGLGDADVQDLYEEALPEDGVEQEALNEVADLRKAMNAAPPSPERDGALKALAMLERRIKRGP